MDKTSLAKNLFYLFLTATALAIVGALTSDTISEKLPLISNLASIVGVICTVVYIVILWNLSIYNDRYKKAAIWKVLSALITVVMISGIIGFLFTFQSDLSHLRDGLFGELVTYVGIAGVLTLLAGLIELILDLCATYNEYMAHSELMATYDETYTSKWRRLWKFTFWAIIASIFAMMLMIFVLLSDSYGLVSLCMAITFIAGIVAFVASIYKLIYLYHMSKIIESVNRINEQTLNDTELK